MANLSICSVDGCNKPAKNRGMCWAHYCRVRRHGDASFVKKPANGTAQDYLQNVVLHYDGDECLLWPFARDKKGYGRVSYQDRMPTVSRIVCIASNGPPLVAGMEAAHSCGKGHLGCVTRSHIRWASPSENNLDKRDHGTDNRGIRHYRTLLTESDVIEIRNLRGSVFQKDLAKRYGVSRGCIDAIHRGTTWKHLR